MVPLTVRRFCQTKPLYAVLISVCFFVIGFVLGSTDGYSLDQTIDHTLNYYNLTLSGSGTKKLDGDTTVRGNFTIKNRVTFDPNGYTINVNGSFVNDGTVALTVSGITAADKIYDGTTHAAIDITGAALKGAIVVGGINTVTLDTAGAIGTFNSPDIATANIVTVSGLTLTGTDVDHYILKQLTIPARITHDPTAASEVVLKSGQKIEGRIVEKTDKYIKIDTGIGMSVTFYADEIDTVDGQKIQDSAPSTPETQVVPPTLETQVVPSTPETQVVPQTEVKSIDEGQLQNADVNKYISDLKSPDPQVHKNAIEALAKIGEPAVGPLITALKDPDPNVRMSAVIALSGNNEPRVVEALIAALKDPDPNFRSFAASALRRVNDPRAADALVYDLKDNDNLAKATLRAMSTACESYATSDNGNYPTSEDVLTTAQPPYLNSAYCATSQANAKGIAGYKYDCSGMTASGYTIIATPVIVGTSGTTTETIRTGGVLSP